MKKVIIETDRRHPNGKTFLKTSETLLRPNKGVAHTLTTSTSGGVQI